MTVSRASFIACRTPSLFELRAVDAADYRVMRIKELEREVGELRETNEILKLVSAYFSQAEFDRHHRK